MKILISLLLLIPSLSWGNHEVLICEDYYEYSFSEDHTIIFINNLDGTTEAFNIVDSNEVWIYYQHFEDESRDKSFNRYSKEIDGYKCQVFEVGSSEYEKVLKQETTKTNEEPITIAEIDKLRQQLHSCLNLNVPITDLRNLKPIINIKVNPDRTVKSAKLINKDKLSDQNFRVAADASLRAIYSPECSPLELPEGKYSQWKEINFTFNFSWKYD